ncbi:hypothetical protein [Clostridium sp. JN-1]|jgi:hypothetical protein|uniref:hypothetical protein n=1 Tax=Clostridium sp. JN-1 TaxID=2483110 RepID=UPI000F0BCC11|nr:hypothetical protein [Clostridium sp. JN-1]
MADDAEISSNGIKQIDNYVDKFLSKMIIPKSEESSFKEELKSNLIFSVEELLSKGVEEDFALRTTFNRFGSADYTESNLKDNNTNVKKMSNSARLIGKLISIALCIILIGMLIAKSKYVPIAAFLTIVFCIIFMYKDKKLRF